MSLNVENKFSDVCFSEGENIYEINYEIKLRDIPELKRKPDGTLYNQGNFDGTVYDFNYDTQYVAEILGRYDFAYALRELEYKEYIKYNRGIKIIRDGFVVQGYGDGSLDWLSISSQATTKGKYTDLKNENLIGYIRLTGLHNQSLKETTSREGFINDEYYQNFYSIIRNTVIKKINWTNNKLSEIFKDYLSEISVDKNPKLKLPVENVKSIIGRAQSISAEIKKYAEIKSEIINKKTIEAEKKKRELTLFADGPAYKELEEIISMQQDLITKLQRNYSNIFTEVEDIKQSIIIIEEDFQKFNEKISDVFELAGLGISVELFTHELYTTINNVNEKTKSLAPKSPEMGYISNAMNTLRKQISYFYPGLKFVRMKKEKFSLTDMVNDHLNFYKYQADAKKINFVIQDLSSNAKISAHKGILNQVLDNLISNSLYWLLYSRDKLKIIKNCEYHIVINTNFTIEISDNGIGVSRDIEKDLFSPFSSHKENGRGLGLFICQQNLENNNASIRLLRERNTFNNLYKFKIDLSNLKVNEA